jgi:hypothetical protein
MTNGRPISAPAASQDFHVADALDPAVLKLLCSPKRMSAGFALQRNWNFEWVLHSGTCMQLIQKVIVFKAIPLACILRHAYRFELTRIKDVL